MRKSCLKSANNDDALQSMHLVRTVGSVHATNKNIENELSHTWPRHPKDKCSRKALNAQLRTFGHARYTNVPFSHLTDTFALSFLSDNVLRYQILQKTQIRLLP